MKCPHCNRVIATQRTKAQNNALHKFCSQLAEMLNDMGLDIRTVLKPTYNMPWTTSSVKDHLWRPFQKSLTGKKSTTQLKKVEGEIELIHSTLMRELGERHSVEFIPFPSRCQTCESIDCVCD